jgi:O-6-methylguanine DNA methyltransferase
MKFKPVKFKPAATKNTPVWAAELRYADRPVLALQMADGTLIASAFIIQRSKNGILAEWQRKYPQLSWQQGKPPKPADLKMVAPIGTDFQRAVWEKTAGIKQGSILTYNDIAAAIGKPRAARAVGTALGANPLCPFIPCHRVVGSNGTIGGYSGVGGLDTKRALLKKENIILAD